MNTETTTRTTTVDYDDAGRVVSEITVTRVETDAGSMATQDDGWPARDCDHDNGECHDPGHEPTTGVDLIAAERRRQIDVEGWTPEHDAAHGTGDLARAAATYALPEDWRSDDLWPWHPRHWKPSPDDRVRELVKAGALIAAEIDRLQTQGGDQEAGE